MALAIHLGNYLTLMGLSLSSSSMYASSICLNCWSAISSRMALTWGPEQARVKTGKSENRRG